MEVSIISQWWLTTWTTYGTWLPGDPRGYCTRRKRVYVPPPARYAKPGEETCDAAKHAAKYEMAKRETEAPLVFRPAQRQLVRDALIEEIAVMEITPAIASIGAKHIHMEAQFALFPIRKAVGRIKAAAIRKLNENGFVGKRPWTKGCGMKLKTTVKAFEKRV